MKTNNQNRSEQPLPTVERYGVSCSDLFSSVFLSDDAIDRKSQAIRKGEQSREAMMAVKYLEAHRIAKDNYRKWKLQFFLNIGPAPHPSVPRFPRNLNTLTHLRCVKTFELMAVAASLWMEMSHVEGELPILPNKVVNILKRHGVEIPTPIAEHWGADVVERPPGDDDHRAYPLVKDLLRHVRKALTRSLLWKRHHSKENV